MTKISLYPARPTSSLPCNMQQTHWRDAAVECERRLKLWLGLDGNLDLLMTDRATAAIQLGLRWLRAATGRSWIRVHPRTFRSVYDAACQETGDVEFAESIEPVMNRIQIPTTFGGTAPYWEFLTTTAPILYDCCHTAYPGMFGGIRWGPHVLAVLSFYPTKPLGAFGGGALIGPADVIKHLRKRAWPDVWWYRCEFVYPQTVQSYGVMDRIASWSPTWWVYQLHHLNQITQLIATHLLQDPCFPCGNVRSPHLLSYRRTPALERLCELAELETGSHYPDLRNSQPDTHRITIPFHCEEIKNRMEAHIDEVKELVVGLRHHDEHGPETGTCPR